MSTKNNPNHETQVALFRSVTKEMEKYALTRKWDVCQDHCFQRILLDNLFGGCWYDFLDPRKPAHSQISTETLITLTATALRILNEHEPDFNELNELSKQWRFYRLKEGDKGIVYKTEGRSIGRKDGIGTVIKDYGYSVDFAANGKEENVRKRCIMGGVNIKSREIVR